MLIPQVNRRSLTLPPWKRRTVFRSANDWSPFGFQYYDENGLPYPGLFSSWDDYASWATGLASIIDEQDYSDKMQGKLATILGVTTSDLTPVGLRGGNANFVASASAAQRFISNDPTCQSGSFGIRCSDITLHFTAMTDAAGAINSYNVHIDSADFYSLPWGAILHGLIDVIGGNTIFSGGVPH